MILEIPDDWGRKFEYIYNDLSEDERNVFLRNLGEFTGKLLNNSQVNSEKFWEA